GARGVRARREEAVGPRVRARVPGVRDPGAEGPVIGIGAARRLVEGLLGDPNRRGRSYAVTVLARISDGQTDALRAELRAFTSGDSPLAELAGVHFGRWVVVD